MGKHPHSRNYSWILLKNHSDAWNKEDEEHDDECTLEMEILEMLQWGEEGFDSILKRASQISLNLKLHSYGECKILLNEHRDWDSSLWIPFFSFPRFLFFFNFLFHHCFGRAPTPKLFHWPADSTHSFTTFLSRNNASSSPLCAHYTLPLIGCNSLYKDLPGTASPSCCFKPFQYLTSPSKIAALLLWVIFLYLFSVNTAHTYTRARGQPHSLFIREGMEAYWWF